MDQTEGSSMRSADRGDAIVESESASAASNRTTLDENAPRRNSARILATSALLLAGAASGFFSWFLQSTEPWWSNMLGNLSVTIVLLVPAEIALTWIRQGFRNIQNRTEVIREIAENARDTAASTEQSLADEILTWIITPSGHVTDGAIRRLIDSEARRNGFERRPDAP